MICSALCRIMDARALEYGSRAVNEPYSRSDLNAFQLALMHKGKDHSIDHMLEGGNGFPATDDRIEYDQGCTIERRDLRALLMWQSSLDQCIEDKKRGVE